MLQLRTLGSTSLVGDDGAPVTAVLRQPKRFALLAYLALARPLGFHRRDAVLALFWPELDTERARASLRQALYTLRRELPEGVLVNRGDAEVGVAHDSLWCDVHEMERRIAAGDGAGALELYRGDLLTGFHVPDASPELEQWIDGERARVHGLAVQTATELTDAAAEAGDAEEAARWAARAAALSPLDEELARREIELRHGAGDRAGALIAFEQWAERLARELELEPLPETVAVVERVRRGPPAEPRNRGERGSLARPRPRIPGTASVSAAGGSAIAAVATHSAPATSPARRWRPRPWHGAALAAVGILMWGLSAMLPLGLSWRDGAAATGASRLVVVPFGYHGEGEASYLSEGLVYLFSVAMDGEELRVVDPNGPGVMDAGARRSHDYASAAAVAERAGAGHFLLGNVVETEGRIQLTASLYERGGSQPVARASVSGTHEELLSLVDAVAGELLAARVGRGSSRAVQLAAVTSHSLPALKAYLGGERLMREGRYREAIAAFEEAVREDSLFALAHYRISQAASWAFQGELSTRAAAQAVRFADRLPERERRLLLAHEAYRQGRAAEALPVLQDLAASYPDDPEVWVRLGEVRIHFGPLLGWRISEAREPFERTVALDSGSTAALYHLAQLAALDGETGAGLEYTDRALAAAPSASRATQLRLLAALLGRGDPDHAIEALAAADDFTIVSSAYMAAIYAHRPVVALRVADVLVQPERPAGTRAFGHLLQANLELARGRIGAARAHLEALARLDPARAELHRALLSAAPWGTLLAPVARIASEPPEALGPADRWQPEAALGPIPRLYAHGLAAAARGNLGEAEAAAGALAAAGGGGPAYADDVRLAAAHASERDLPATSPVSFDVSAEHAVLTPFLSRPARRYLEARRLEAQGRAGEALVWYESLETFSIPDLAWGVPALLDRARIHEVLGEAAAAAALYRRFAELVAAADDPEPRRFALERLARREAPRDR